MQDIARTNRDIALTNRKICVELKEEKPNSGIKPIYPKPMNDDKETR